MAEFFKKLVFRIAFAGFIAIEVILFGVLAAGISTLFPANRAITEGLYLSLSLISMCLIGIGSYMIFQRMTRTQYVLTESERWLANRRGRKPEQIRRCSRLRRRALWIPTVTVIVVCTFIDYAWPLATHLLHPGRGRLIGYEVRIPLTWSIAYSDYGKEGDANTIVVIERYRGLIKAGSGYYLGPHRPFTTSNINFRTFPTGDPLVPEPATKIISSRTLSFAKGTIECRDKVPPRWMKSGHYIRCATLTGDFSAIFDGADEDVTEFYRMVSSVKPLR